MKLYLVVLSQLVGKNWQLIRSAASWVHMIVINFLYRHYIDSCASSLYVTKSTDDLQEADSEQQASLVYQMHLSCCCCCMGMLWLELACIYYYNFACSLLWVYPSGLMVELPMPAVKVWHIRGPHITSKSSSWTDLHWVLDYEVYKPQWQFTLSILLLSYL